VSSSGDEAAVEKAAEELRLAMLAADKAKLAALLSDKLSYGHSSAKIETKADVLDVIGGKKTIYKSIAQTETVVVVSGGTAVLRNVFDNHTETDGKPGHARVGVMQTWAKEGGAWKLIGRQAFRFPQ
jgi:ketosteroid isomerase-like protein